MSLHVSVISTKAICMSKAASSRIVSLHTRKSFGNPTFGFREKHGLLPCHNVVCRGLDKVYGCLNFLPGERVPAVVDLRGPRRKNRLLERPYPPPPLLLQDG